MRRIALPLFALLVGCAIGHTVARGPRKPAAPPAHVPVPREVTIRTTPDVPPVTVAVHAYRAAAGPQTRTAPTEPGTPYTIYFGDDFVLFGTATPRP